MTPLLQHWEQEGNGILREHENSNLDADLYTQWEYFSDIRLICRHCVQNKTEQFATKRHSLKSTLFFAIVVRTLNVESPLLTLLSVHQSIVNYRCRDV